jgi:hypothetical protein
VDVGQALARGEAACVGSRMEKHGKSWDAVSSLRGLRVGGIFRRTMADNPSLERCETLDLGCEWCRLLGWDSLGLLLRSSSGDKKKAIFFFFFFTA